MRTIEGRPTWYQDHEMRSMLEVHWAIMLDEMSVRWEYELAYFDFGTDGMYLPDFWLKDLGVWLEVKGPYPTEEERLKCMLLEATTGYSAVIAYGDPLHLLVNAPDIEGGILHCEQSGDCNIVKLDWDASSALSAAAPTGEVVKKAVMRGEARFL